MAFGKRNSYPSSSTPDVFAPNPYQQSMAQEQSSRSGRVSEALNGIDPELRARAAGIAKGVGMEALIGAAEGSKIAKRDDNGNWKLRPSGVIRAAVNPYSAAKRAAAGAVKGGVQEARSQGNALAWEAAAKGADAFTGAVSNRFQPAAEISQGVWGTQPQAYEQPAPTTINDDPFARTSSSSPSSAANVDPFATSTAAYTSQPAGVQNPFARISPAFGANHAPEAAFAGSPNMPPQPNEYVDPFARAPSPVPLQPAPDPFRPRY